MQQQTKCTAVNLTVKQFEKLKTIKELTGKSQNTILAECIENGLAKFLMGNKQLYWVKVRIDKSKIMELGQKLQAGELDTSMIKFTYCIKEDPTVGNSLWEVNNKQELERLLAPHKEFYRDIIEINEVVFPEEAMKLILKEKNPI